MNRLTLAMASLALGLSVVGGVSAQDTTTAPPTVSTTADGGYSSADPNNPMVVNQGENRVYGDIATGGTGGEVYGDPAALANIQTAEEIAATVPPPNTTGGSTSDGIILPPPGTVTEGSTSPAPSDGSTSPAPDGSTAPAEGTTTDGATQPAPAPAGACGYATWYDSQVAYEAAGGLNGDPALVQAMDPDYDGVACEELIVY